MTSYTLEIDRCDVITDKRSTVLLITEKIRRTPNI